jgi:hypothetical protein
MAYASVHQFTQALKTGGEGTMPVSDDVTVDATVHMCLVLTDVVAFALRKIAPTLSQ